MQCVWRQKNIHLDVNKDSNKVGLNYPYLSHLQDGVWVLRKRTHCPHAKMQHVFMLWLDIYDYVANNSNGFNYGNKGNKDTLILYNVPHN